MGKDRRKLSLALLVLLVSAFAALLYRASLQAPASPPPGIGQRPVFVQHAGFAFNDELDPHRYGVLPPSEWQGQRAGIWRQVLEKAPTNRYDLLLIPVQNYPADQGLIRSLLEQVGRPAHLQRSIAAVTTSTRSRMSIALAERIAAADPGRRLPDPMIVRRALGEERRTYTDDAVHSLAEALGVPDVIVVYVGYLPPRHLVATARVYRSGPDTQLTLGPVEFSDTELPEDVFAGLLDRVIAALPPVTTGSTPAQPAAGQSSAPGGSRDLPATPELLASAAPPDSLEAVRALQVYGLLAPAAPRRAGERFFERSLALLDRIDPARKERLLRARALFHLGRRPAALAVLGDPGTAAERALRALMDGNDVSIGSSAGEIDDPVEQFIARAEQLMLINEYDGRRDASDRIKELAAAHEGWAPVLWHKLTENDTWTRPSNLLLAGEIERVFPLAGYSVRERLAVGGSIAPTTDLEISRLVFEHGARIIARDRPAVCCDPIRQALMPPDYLDLLLAHVESNLLRQVDHQLSTQGSAERALHMIGELRPVFDGHPELAALEAEAQLKSAGQDDDIAKRGKLRRAAEVAINALNWSGGQSTYAARAASALFGAERAMRELGADNELPKGVGDVISVYASDFPPLSDWDRVFGFRGDEGTGLAGSWDYEHAEVYPLATRMMDLANTGMVEQADALRAANEHRFKSDPMRGYFLAEYLQHTGRSEQALVLHREAVEAGTKEWTSYSEYGNHLIRSGRFADAQAVYLRYPGFAPDSSFNRVAISNYAYDAGSELFWRGAHEESKALFRIGADLDAGSGASMGSAQRLALLDGDWVMAADYAWARADRYRDVFAYRDLLGLLFATGQSADAWPLFDALSVRVADAALWFAAHTGLRVAGKTDEEVDAWVRERLKLVSDPESISLLTKFALVALTADRKPGDLASDVLADLQSAGGLAVPAAEFARAYAATRRADWSRAWGALNGFRQSIGPESGVYQLEWLPVVTRAALHTGHRRELQTVLERLDGSAAVVDEVRFSAKLMRAQITAADAAIDESLGELKAARATLPIRTDWSYHPWYLLLETAEGLYADTGDERYRDLLVDWARAVQHILPTVSWGYVFVACHGRDEKEKREALGVALHLDRHSARLEAIDQAVREAAAKDFARRKPFDLKLGHESMPSAARAAWPLLPVVQR